MIHSAEPGQVPKKLVAESGFEPGKILVLGGPAAHPALVLAPLMTEYIPGVLALARFHAAPNEVSSLGGQGQMFTTFSGGGSAKRAISLVHHSSSVLPGIRISPISKIVKKKRHSIVTFDTIRLTRALPGREGGGARGCEVSPNHEPASVLHWRAA